MKATFIIICAAVFYAHVARGLPTDVKKPKPENDPAPAPVAAAPEKPDTCKATIEGKEQTVQPGDRYCLDDTTARVCNWGGEWIDQKCDPGSKCLKSKTEYKVLCRIVNRNAPQPGQPQDSDVQPNPKSPETPSNPPPAPKPQVDPVPPPAPQQPPKVDNPQPEPPKQETKVDPPKQENPKVDSVPPPPAPKVEPVPATPEKPETCKATINGQEQTLQPGDRYCLDDNTNRVCNWGEFVDYACPNGSKCLKSPDKWAVLCRIINRNAAPNAPGADGH